MLSSTPLQCIGLLLNLIDQQQTPQVCMKTHLSCEKKLINLGPAVLPFVVALCERAVDTGGIRRNPCHDIAAHSPLKTPNKMIRKPERTFITDFSLAASCILLLLRSCYCCFSFRLRRLTSIQSGHEDDSG